MLGDQDAQATVAVRDLKTARPFYEGILGLKPLPSDQPSVQAFQAGKSLVLVYESPFAGTNKATVLTWALGETFESAVLFGAAVLRELDVPDEDAEAIAEQVRRGPGGEHTLVVGHPFIDIWEAVKPARLGIAQWPVVPKGQDWKHGVCEALGWRHRDQADIAAAWQRIRGRVRDWTDLEPELIGRVEELIDFVTAPV